MEMALSNLRGDLDETEIAKRVHV